MQLFAALASNLGTRRAVFIGRYVSSRKHCDERGSRRQDCRPVQSYSPTGDICEMLDRCVDRFGASRVEVSLCTLDRDGKNLDGTRRIA